MLDEKSKGKEIVIDTAPAPADVCWPAANKNDRRKNKKTGY
jgi:hypothetical protein